MQQRYYDPQIGGFLSVDPEVVETTSAKNFGRYKYASGNPYKFVDPDGRSDLNFVPDDDRMSASNKAFDVPGMFTITGHGNPSGIANFRTGGYPSTEQLVRGADRMGHQPHEPILVTSCNFGMSSQHQDLANKSLSPVFATTGFVMMPGAGYKSGDPFTVTANTQANGKGAAATFTMKLPFGTRDIGRQITSIDVNPKKGTATVHWAPEKVPVQ